MDELLKKAAELRGMPESLVERSAQARAKKEGIPVEQILSEWAGVAQPAAEEAPPAEETPPEEPAEEVPAEEVAATEGVAEEEPEAEAAAGEEAAAAPAEEPKVQVLEPATTETEEAAAEEPAVGEAEPAASLARRYPVWLAATFVFVPLLAVFYIVTLPNGPSCGSAGRLDIHPVTGVAVNCDGTPYGVDVVNNFTAGEALYAASCASCHGPAGGGGSGPALSGGSVLATFPADACADHRTWVALGTQGWAAEIGSTYGATNKPVGGFGVMPDFGNSLSETEISQVAIYERVAFGGEALADAETECLPEGEGEGAGAALGS